MNQQSLIIILHNLVLFLLVGLSDVEFWVPRLFEEDPALDEWEAISMIGSDKSFAIEPETASVIAL